MMVISILFVGLLVKVEFAMPASNQGFLGGFGMLVKNQAPNLILQNNLQNLLDAFASQASKIGFHNSTLGEGPDQVHGLYMCRGDIDSQGCSECISQVTDAILSVTDNNNSRWNLGGHNFFQKVVWYDRCMVRYSNTSFIGEMDTTIGHSAVWSQLDGTWNRIRFAEVLRDTMNHLAVQAAYDKSKKGFATKMVKLTTYESLHAMGQCTWDLTPSDCYKCLTKAIRQLLIINRYRRSRGRAFYSNCMVWYETSLLLNTTTNPPLSSSPSVTTKNLTTSSLSGSQQGDAEVM